MDLLADKTLGDPDLFSDQTPEDIIEEIRSQLTVTANQKYIKERERYRETRAQLERIEFAQHKINQRLDKISNIGAVVLTGIITILFIGGVVIQIIPGLFSSFTVLRVFLLVLTTILGALSVYTGFNIRYMRYDLRAFFKRQLNRLFSNITD
jgi:hypothetical protein